MKILWIVNTIFPYPSEKMGTEKDIFGGWLIGLADKLKDFKEIELSIVATYTGESIKKFYDGKILYYLMPGSTVTKYNKNLNKYCKEIVNDFKPDILHIHGTEFAHGLSFFNVCNKEVKKVASIQGLTSCISKVYLAGISNKEIVNNITLRDIIKRDNLFQQKKKFENRGEYEKEIIKECKYIIGRTEWDYANTKAINPHAKYYLGNEILRSCFYYKEWNIEEIEDHSIFCSQAGYPIKGIHYALEAIYILKKKYKDVKLYIAGNNIVSTNTLKDKLKLSGYAKYLNKLIKKYHLEDNIVFTGILNEEEILERLLKSNVFILPSAIENSSNSLGEAMLLGMPCVASNAGGTMDMMEHNKEGFLYPYTEPAMLAEYISKYFENDELCLAYGKNARKKASNRHDPKQNVEKIIEVYKDIIKGE